MAGRSVAVPGDHLIREAQTPAPSTPIFRAVPPDAMAYSLNHLPIPASLRQNITIATYDSGHMMYLLDKDAAKLREDIVGWLK